MASLVLGTYIKGSKLMSILTFEGLTNIVRRQKASA
jgi:hypothetical protein